MPARAPQHDKLAALPAFNMTKSLLPAIEIETAASPDGTTTVEIGGRAVGIGTFASERILVSVSL